MTVPPPPPGQRFNPPPGWPATDPNWMPPPGWQPPPDFPPAPSNWQWYTPVAPPKRKGFMRRHKILTGLGAVVLLIIIIAIATSSGSNGSPNAKSSPAPADSPPSSQQGSPSTAATAQAPAAPKVLLAVAGNGIKQTQKFTAAGDWDLSYTYTCAAFGGSGNFIVDVYGGDGNLSFANGGVNALGAKGADVTHEHKGGTFYLSVNSECDWTVKVTG